MGKIVGLAFTSALNPSLVAATTVMLLLPRQARLMLGYWFGAMLTSITLGLVIVFTLEGSGFEQTAKKTAHPTIALTLAGLLLLVVIGFCLVSLVLLEIPLVAFRVAPEQTPAAIDRAKAWGGGHWRRVAICGLAVIAAGLAIIGIAELR